MAGSHVIERSDFTALLAMQRFASAMLGLLQATRLQLLDVYGNARASA